MLIQNKNIYKKVFLKILFIPGSAALLKRDSDTGVFL